MSVHDLLDPILDQGIRHTNFFEGRLLTARDLRDQQEANRERDRRLGRAIGEGIVEGLEVVLENDGADGAVPVVTVRKGLAVTGDGEIIGLPEHDVQVALSRSIEAVPTTEADFYACAGPPTTRHLPNGVGVYLLVMAPAAGYRDRAPKSGLGDEGIVKGCGSRYVQEGVRFRLVDATPGVLAESDAGLRALLEDDLLSATDPAGQGETARLSLLRNVLAYQRFRGDTERLGPLALTLPKPAIAATPDESAIEACELPVALIYWTLDGIAFIDLWSVRRMLAPATPGSETRRRETRGRERVRQFTEQMDWLLARLGYAERADVRVIDYLRFLPPVGVVPLAGTFSQVGFNYAQFFTGIPHRNNGPRPDETEPFVTDLPVVEGRAADALVVEALGYPAHDLVSDLAGDASQRTFLWLFQVRERRQAIVEASGAAPPPYLLFASGHLPEFGEARLNRARWGYANFA